MGVSDTRKTVAMDIPTNVVFPGGMVSSGQNLGYGKTIISVRDKFFTPGRWRYNPCTILYGSVTSKPESLTTRYGQITGYPAYHAAQNHINAAKGWIYTTPQGSIPGFLAEKARISASNKRLDSPFAGGLFLAELKETAGMLRKPLSGCLSLLKKARKATGNKRSTKAKKAAWESWWLEYRYGWTPLAHDVDDVAQMAIAHIRKAQKSFFVTHGREKFISCDKTNTGGYIYKNSSLKVAFDIITTTSARIRATTGWDYVVGYEDEEKWASIGMGRPDVWGILYEKIPFSFVLDWWLGVGDFLKYLRPTPFVHMKGQGVSVSYDWVREYIPTQVWAQNTAGKLNNGITIHQRSYKRDIPTSSIELPVLDTRFASMKHVADSLALLIQKGKR